MSGDVWTVGDEQRSTTRFRLPTRRPLRYAILAVLGLVLVLVVLAVVIGALYVRPGSHGFVAQGRNMAPTIEPGDHLSTVPARRPHPGDIVVYRRDAGYSDRSEFLSRVIATAGHTISCPPDPGQSFCSAVRIDDKPIDEHAYLNVDGAQGQPPFPPVTVPDGRVFLLGDRRNDSADSRLFGPVPAADVIGQVRLRYLPLSRVGRIH